MKGYILENNTLIPSPPDPPPGGESADDYFTGLDWLIMAVLSLLGVIIA